MKRIGIKIYQAIERIYHKWDKKFIRRSKNIKLVPNFSNRRGGKLSYLEWGHVIGIFQTFIFNNIKDVKRPHIVDIGCGTGLLAIASEPFVKNGGKYVGIDVMEKDILFCQENYDASCFEFYHHNVHNPTYSLHQNLKNVPWVVEKESTDLVTALSVWTHLDEQDSIFYMHEVSRVLKKGGRAMITMFLLDEHYYDTIGSRNDEISEFHNTNQRKWIFDENAYQSHDWFTTKWVKVPEDAIGITKIGLEKMINGSQLRIREVFSGSWREKAAPYFQDIIIFEKA